MTFQGPHRARSDLHDERHLRVVVGTAGPKNSLHTTYIFFRRTVSLKSHLARSRFAVDEPALIGSLNVSLLALHKLNLYSVAIAHLIGSAAAATCCEPPLRWHVSRRVAAEPPTSGNCRSLLRTSSFSNGVGLIAQNCFRSFRSTSRRRRRSPPRARLFFYEWQ